MYRRFLFTFSSFEGHFDLFVINLLGLVSDFTRFVRHLHRFVKHIQALVNDLRRFVSDFHDFGCDLQRLRLLFFVGEAIPTAVVALLEDEAISFRTINRA